jgi:hypothetical protein
MTTLSLDASGWRTREDVWVALLDALQAPGWHGHNLDALDETVRSADVNGVNAPFVVQVTGSAPGPEAQFEVTRLGSFFRDVSADGVPVAWTHV